jgi:hypothetical protein
MPNARISREELSAEITGRIHEFPKYVTQILNLANQNAGGTRPKVVGQLTELFPEYGGRSFDEWKEWYEDKMPDAIDEATSRVYDMVGKLKDAINSIDRPMVREWVEDLVLAKTFIGLCFQESILSKVAELKGENFQISTPAEESQGIDGYIGDTPVSIKPESYDAKHTLIESLPRSIIRYKKRKDGGIDIDYDI